jgi:CelD/BcsL family acetyltransferase involved in cellulose biosynthesis
VSIATITSEQEFAALASEGWDGLVRTLPRPSPYLLHAWLVEWWRYYGSDGEPRVHVLRRDGRLAAALPLFVRRRGGVRVAEFLGSGEAVLGDVLAEDDSAATEVLEEARRAGYHLADLLGVPVEGRLVQAMNGHLHLVERVPAPVLDLSAGWEEVYRAKTGSKKRNLHARRRKQLAALGRLEVEVARTAEELDVALDDAFRLHAVRWHGRNDQSRLSTLRGREFNRAAYRALAAQDVPRIVVLRLDGRAIAFHAYFVLAETMYVHRLAFDPDLARYSPGLVNTLDALAAASGEGVRRVEFLGGAERYKLELADRFEPLYEAVGLARGPGRVLARARVAAIRLRVWAKRSPLLSRLYDRL